MCQPQGYLILEVAAFLWTIIKITFFQFTKTGRESGRLLEAVTGWSSWSISSPFSKSTGWKVAISSVLPDSKPEKNLDPVQPLESFRVHCALASGFTRQLVSSRAAGVLFGKDYNRHHLHFAFEPYEFLWNSLYIAGFLSEELEELKVMECIHRNTAKSLSIEWRTAKTKDNENLF